MRDGPLGCLRATVLFKRPKLWSWVEGGSKRLQRRNPLVSRLGPSVVPLYASAVGLIPQSLYMPVANWERQRRLNFNLLVLYEEGRWASYLVWRGAYSKCGI